jgi:hypothetical protein
MHSEESEQEHEALLVYQTTGDEECCPITNAVVGLRPERITIESQVNGAPPAAFTAYTLPLIHPSTSALRAVPHSISNPPLQQSGILRI